MRLFGSPMSPYVRKVRAVAIETRLDGQIKFVPCRVREVNNELRNANPLARIPTLIRDDGQALYDSPVICEYFDSLHDGPKLLPAAGEARWRVLRTQALGDGIMDAAVPRRDELSRPEEQRSSDWLKIYVEMIGRALDQLDREVDVLGDVSVGSITIGCALGYLDFRFQDDHWREGRSRLAAWFDAFSQRASLARTTPCQL